MKFKIHKHNHNNSLSRLLPDESAEGAKTIRRVVKIGCIVNATLMILKLTAGYFGHSDALIADGFHSVNDLSADLIMLIFVGISYRAADDRYAYGYGKFETFSSFLMSAFLIIVAMMIGKEGIESIIEYAHGKTLEQPDIWTIIVVLFAIACKECLFRFYSHAGKKANSKALLANAWHHRSDAMASIATLIGVSSAHFFGTSWRILDPVASLLIAIFILIPAIRLLRPSFTELMDKSLPADQIARAREVIEKIKGVEGINNLKTRRNGHHLLFDACIEIAPYTTIEEGEAIASDIESALKKEFCPHVMVSVTTRSAINKK